MALITLKLQAGVKSTLRLNKKGECYEGDGHGQRRDSTLGMQTFFPKLCIQAYFHSQECVRRKGIIFFFLEWKSLVAMNTDEGVTVLFLITI